jgi:hypothetical protein
MSPTCKTVIGFEPKGKTLIESFRTTYMARSKKMPQIATIASAAKITMGQLVASFMDPR